MCWSLWVSSSLRYCMILVSPHMDSEHHAGCFCYVKDKILLGCVTAKACPSLSVYKYTSNKCLLVYFAKQIISFPLLLQHSHINILYISIVFLVILLELVWRGQWSFHRTRHLHFLCELALETFTNEGAKLRVLDLNLELMTETWEQHLVWNIMMSTPVSIPRTEENNPKIRKLHRLHLQQSFPIHL